MSKSLIKQKKLISISQAAKVLGVSIDTIRRWDKSGVLHSERPDGKNRYFSLSELEEHKQNRPLSISEVAKEFNISPTTLRRLEARGLIQPNRNSAGERLYNKKEIENFFKNEYLHRNKSLNEPSVEITEKKEVIIENNQPTQKTDLDLASNIQIHSYVPNFFAISIALFILLSTVGTGNVVLFKTFKYEMISFPNILSQKLTPPPLSQVVNSQSNLNKALPSPTPSEKVQASAVPLSEFVKKGEIEEASPNPNQVPLDETIKLVQIKIHDGSKEIGLMEAPESSAKKIKVAQHGDMFAYVSSVPGWIEVRPQEISEPGFVFDENSPSGFIPKKYAEIREFEFASIESGWSEIKATKENIATISGERSDKDDKSAN